MGDMEPTTGRETCKQEGDETPRPVNMDSNLTKHNNKYKDKLDTK